MRQAGVVENRTFLDVPKSRVEGARGQLRAEVDFLDAQRATVTCGKLHQLSPDPNSSR
jgi:hypothetical protein